MDLIVEREHWFSEQLAARRTKPLHGPRRRAAHRLGRVHQDRVQEGKHLEEEREGGWEGREGMERKGRKRGEEK